MVSGKSPLVNSPWSIPTWVRLKFWVRFRLGGILSGGIHGGEIDQGGIFLISEFMMVLLIYHVKLQMLTFFIFINPFHGTDLFLYTQKTSEKNSDFLIFSEGKKDTSGMIWVNDSMSVESLYEYNDYL